MGNKVLAYDRDGHRVWLQGRKVWIEDPSGQLMYPPVGQPKWPKQLRRCLAAALLKTFSDGHGLGLAIPAEDLQGPDGGTAQAHYVSPEEHARVLAGEPMERVLPSYRLSHISIFLEGQHAWITNRGGGRIDVPLAGTDEVPVELRRCFAAALLDMVGRSNGFGWDIPEHDFLGPDGGRATFMKTPNGQMYEFQYVKLVLH
jgi:hypothetical protein